MSQKIYRSIRLLKVLIPRKKGCQIISVRICFLRRKYAFSQPIREKCSRSDQRRRQFHAPASQLCIYVPRQASNETMGGNLLGRLSILF